MGLTVYLPISYGTPASANSTFSCPGIRPATGWIPNLTFFPFFLNNIHTFKTVIFRRTGIPDI